MNPVRSSVTNGAPSIRVPRRAASRNIESIAGPSVQGCSHRPTSGIMIQNPRYCTVPGWEIEAALQDEVERKPLCVRSRKCCEHWSRSLPFEEERSQRPRRQRTVAPTHSQCSNVRAAGCALPPRMLPELCSSACGSMHGRSPPSSPLARLLHQMGHS